jgi:hypothetical protein
MERFKYVAVVMVVLAMAFVFAGCAKAPDEEKAAAKSAMDAAVAAGADKYATADFTAAKGQWDTAESQVNDKKYKEAKQSYIDAKAGFEKATAGVEAGKKAMADDANAAITSVENDWNNVVATEQKFDKSMKDKKEAWDADAKTVTDGLKAAKDMVATDPVGAKAKAGELKALVDKWDGTFKEMAAAPANPETPKKK